MRCPYRTAGNATTAKIMREAGEEWQAIGDALNLPPRAVSGWAKKGYPLNQNYPFDAELSDRVETVWRRWGNVLPANKVDEKVANITGKPLLQCREARIKLGLTRAVAGKGSSDELSWRTKAMEANDKLVEAMCIFYANREERAA